MKKKTTKKVFKVIICAFAVYGFWMMLDGYVEGRVYSGMGMLLERIGPMLRGGGSMGV